MQMRFSHNLFSCMINSLYTQLGLQEKPIFSDHNHWQEESSHKYRLANLMLS